VVWHVLKADVTVFSLLPHCLTISISVSVLAEILEEHFTRHSKGGKSTKVIVFTQLRATVRAIVADLADTKGGWVTTVRHAQGGD
jgi:hypothetical protein